MLYFNEIFKDYVEFKNMFGIRETTSGGKSRNNGILLSFLKGEFKNRHIVPCVSSLEALYRYCATNLARYGIDNSVLSVFGDNTLVCYSSIYMNDDRRGVCDDGDNRSIRYKRRGDGRIFKMKAGKFMRQIVLECPYLKGMAEQAVIYVCETFASKWEAYTNNLMPTCSLVVDDDFGSIYDSDLQAGNFSSCMNDKGYEAFYKNNCNASAASLRTKDGIIVARCVIFNEVREVDGDKVYRLAERQYAKDQSNVLKEMLVNKLIEGGYIDGFKRIGAGCHDPHLFLLNNGDKLNKNLYIKSRIDGEEDYIPYMDSFKYYNSDEYRLYNSEECNHLYKLECTDGGWECVREWDSYHEYYCESTVNVLCYSIRSGWTAYTCNNDDLSDFAWTNEDYYERKHCYWSSYCNNYIPEDMQVWSEYLEDYLWADCSVYMEDAQDYFPGNDDSYYKNWLAEQEELIEAV